MLVSAKEMLIKAHSGRYAIGQFNLNNLEWIAAILKTAEKLSAPVILGVTEAACAWMGGPRTIRAMAAGLMSHLRIRVPVALHLDHASYEMCLQAIGAGFTSVMFDGSKMPFAENLRLCRQLSQICADKGISLEAELGSPAGEEDGIRGNGERAEPRECAELAASGITSLAAAIGNIHGEYPQNWQGLDFSLLQKIEEATRGLPLVLHGGSGIPEHMIRKAIGLGISKINVNTECQIAFADGLAQYFGENRHHKPKGYNLQKLMTAGLANMEETISAKIKFFGSANKAD